MTSTKPRRRLYSGLMIAGFSGVFLAAASDRGWAAIRSVGRAFHESFVVIFVNAENFVRGCF